MEQLQQDILQGASIACRPSKVELYTHSYKTDEDQIPRTLFVALNIFLLKYAPIIPTIITRIYSMQSYNRIKSQVQRIIFRLPPYDTPCAVPRNKAKFHVHRRHAAGGVCEQRMMALRNYIYL